MVLLTLLCVALSDKSPLQPKFLFAESGLRHHHSVTQLTLNPSNVALYSTKTKQNKLF